MALRPRISLVTLGVADLVRSTAFYEALGWRRSRSASTAGISFFALGELVLALYPKSRLAEDMGLPEATVPSTATFSLAYNTASEEEADAAIALALAAGGTLLQPAASTFWGGYCGYVADPDGHAIEFTHAPGLAMDESGRLSLPD